MRAIRIYPALCVEVILSALVLGPIVTTLPLSQYFLDRLFWHYGLNMMGWVHYFLPGVFANNVFPGIVNTSLWTVPFELECYIAISVLFLLGYMKYRWLVAPMFVAATIAISAFLIQKGESGTLPGSINGRVLMLCFLAGSLLYRIKEYVPFSGFHAITSAAIAILLLRYNYFVFIAPLPAAYVTVYLGLQNPPRTAVVESGDYSYGTYLYGGPIQQTVALSLGAANNWFTNVAVALPATVLFALLSWHLVEKPFLKVKRYILSEKRN